MYHTSSPSMSNSSVSQSSMCLQCHEKWKVKLLRGLYYIYNGILDYLEYRIRNTEYGIQNTEEQENKGCIIMRHTRPCVSLKLLQVSSQENSENYFQWHISEWLQLK